MIPVRTALAAAALLSSATAARSQDLAVRVEHPSGQPIAGALVALLDAGDSVVAEGLSSEQGLRLLRAAPGSYRVRVRRIGFFPYLSGSVSVPHSGELRLVVESQPVSLDTVVVTARVHCREMGENADALMTVWTEAAKALRASQLTLEDLADIGRARVYSRLTNVRGEVIDSSASEFVVDERRPFGAVDPTVLARRGFVRGDEYDGWVYFAPDETVLLSEAFIATHCFRIVRETDRPGQVGVAFEPVPGNRRPDIKGVLWVAERSAELREVSFTYVNVGAASPFQPRGFTSFLRMPSGAWVVDEWQLRLPRVHRRPGAFADVVMRGYAEHGGGLVRTPPGVTR